MKIIKTISLASIVFRLITVVILMIPFVFKVEGQTNYYFSSSIGDDNRTAIQARNPATPWQTLSKLNSFFENILPGDSILLKRGDTFCGTLIVSKSGMADKPIVISAYGNGSKPVISGFSNISSWTALDHNIYEAVVPKKGESINCVVINGKLQPIGRYPKLTAGNGGYLNFESHSEDSQITDIQLTDVPNWTGGEIVIRKNHWVIDRTPIASHKGNVLNFMPVTTFYKLVNGSGYFIQNHPSALTQNGDWCYDYATGKIKIYCTTVPPEVKVSTIDQLVTISSKSWIQLSYISFEGANTRALDVNNAESIGVDSCDFNYSGTFAVSLNQISGDIQFKNNRISNSLSNAVSIRTARPGKSFCTVRNNIITNTGIIAGMGLSGDGKYNAMSVMSGNGAVIEYNTIKKTGYIPLNFSGNNILIKNNIIDSFLMVKQDGAGIYTWNGGNPVKQFTNRTIIGNIVSNGIGNPYGTFDRITEGIGGKANGIYMDNNVNNVEILDNTIFNISNKGNHNNSPSQITMKGNTFFNVGYCFDFYRFVDDGTSPANGGQDITDMNIQNNIFFTTSPEQKAVGYSDRGVNFPNESTIRERISSMGTIDNNYYHLPNELAFTYSYRNDKSNPFITAPPLTFENWKAFTGYEKNGKIIPPIPSNRVRFEVNASKEDKKIELEEAYNGVDGKLYKGSITLKPFTSIILLKNEQK